MLAEGISWLDAISFLLALVTFGVTLRLDLRQTKLLADIRRREKAIEERVK